MTGARQILLIEDEPLIAMMLEDFMESLGHGVAGTVDCVSDGLRAVDGGGFDAAILDVHLRDGEPCWPIADALADRGIAFVLATGGHTQDPPERHRAAPVLAKPYSLDRVDAALKSLLG